MGKKKKETYPRRYQKINKLSDGYRRGYRYIDYGATWKSGIRFLKKKPKNVKTAKTKPYGG